MGRAGIVGDLTVLCRATAPLLSWIILLHILVFSFTETNNLFVVVQLQARLIMDNKQCRYYCLYELRFRWLKRKRMHLELFQSGLSLQLLVPSTTAKMVASYIECSYP